MVGFVLQAPGKLACAGDRDRVLAKVNAGGNSAGGPRADGGDTRHGQASLQILGVAAEFNDLGIDQVADLLLDVVGEDRQRRADLVRGETCAARLPDRVKHVLDKPRQRIIESSYGFTTGPQEWVTQVAKRTDCHTRLRSVSTQTLSRRAGGIQESNHECPDAGQRMQALRYRFCV